jgi:RNA 3'-terminal phosphate cyclase (ATP)
MKKTATETIEIDGSLHSGSGTLLRYAVALATLAARPLHMTNIRAARSQPGLRPQHLAAARACAEISGGTLERAGVGAREILYRPGPAIRGGTFEWDIGTAGSATMLAFTLLPLTLYAGGPTRIAVHGGLFQDFAPTLFHLEQALVPLLNRMGAAIRIHMERPGYVPKGGGRLIVESEPLVRPLRPLNLPEQGRIEGIRGVALASHLESARVAERMAGRCREGLRSRGLDSAEIEIVEDESAVQKGAALCVTAETDTGAVLSADRAGKPGRPSEEIADTVVRELFEDVAAGATVDRHLADQLILFAALADGESRYRIPMHTDHVQSNLWLVETIPGAAGNFDGRILTIRGIRYAPRAPGP